MSVRTIVDSGFEGLVADVECHITQGLPSITIVGFANKSVNEAKERIRAAFTTLPIDWPRRRITINMAPADVPKEHASFDLAIAVAIMESCADLPQLTKDMAFFGELGLDGQLRPVRGLIGKLISARQQGLTTVIVPSANARQAQLIDGLTIYAADSLAAVYAHLTGRTSLPGVGRVRWRPAAPAGEVDFGDIRGQAQAKRALMIAAAGRHNALLNGPPGTGKTMLAKALVSILPPLSTDEVLETTHLHSLRGKNYGSLITQRPFRSPHHSASESALLGGGHPARPGEISLAHNGVLFLDELPEFRRNVIEALRQPLEERRISLARARDNLTFPANIILVATANPCPCGFYGTSKHCSCQRWQLEAYRRKLSGPILDRIDIYINVENVEHQTLLATDKTELTSGQVGRAVTGALTRQKQRFKDARLNGEMTNRDIAKLQISEPARQLLDQGAKQLNLSPRSYMRTIKVAQTIADLEAADQIEDGHISEALQYRPALALPP